MNLAELSTKVKEVTNYLRDHGDPHVGYLICRYMSLFRITHSLKDMSRPATLTVDQKVVDFFFDYVYKAYLDSYAHKEDYPPPRVTFGDPLVLPTSDQYFRRRVFDHNGVIPQRSRIKEGRNNCRKSRR